MIYEAMWGYNFACNHFFSFEEKEVNPSWCGLLGGVFWEKWSLSFLNFHSNFRHLSQYFWVHSILGGAKVENACCQKLAEFWKTSAISSNFIKTYWNLFWWKIFCHLVIAFGRRIFFNDTTSKKWMTIFSAPFSRLCK